MREKKTKKIAYMGMFVTLALIASYVESLVPFYFGAPGIKLGLANLITVVLIYRSSWKDAVTVSVLRIILSGILFGNVFSIIYSFCGALLSLFFMCLLKPVRGFSVIGISMTGGVVHNLGQLLAAIYLMENGNIMYYFPVLMIAGLVTGTLIGIGAREVLKRLPEIG
ncbi:MAG: Gx transporter family protein [Lachnospiraceae bacterium]|nr:Gx transporter family protein [Lachnospiraceae bacterium]